MDTNYLEQQKLQEDNDLLNTDLFDVKSVDSQMSENLEQSKIIQKNQELQLGINDIKNRDSISVNSDMEKVIKLQDAGNEEDFLINEPRYIGFDRKYADFVSKNENYQIIQIRKKLKEYFNLQEGNKRARYLALKDIDKACGNYTFLRFTLFKGKKKQKLKEEVNDLRKEVQKELKLLGKQKSNVAKESSQKLYKTTTQYENKDGVVIEHRKMERQLSTSEVAQKRYDERGKYGGQKVGWAGRFFAGFVGTVRFLVENPIRLGLKAVTVPFWAVNEMIRPIVKATGHSPQRHIKFPGLHSPFTYSDRTIRTMRRWFGKEIGNKSLHNNDGAGSKWYDAFLVDYKRDKLTNKAIYEEEANLAELEADLRSLNANEDFDEEYYMDAEERESLAKKDQEDRIKIDFEGELEENKENIDGE